MICAHGSDKHMAYMLYTMTAAHLVRRSASPAPKKPRIGLMPIFLNVGVMMTNATRNLRKSCPSGTISEPLQLTVRLRVPGERFARLPRPWG